MNIKYDILWFEFPVLPKIVPIKVLREGVAQGCSLPSIEFKDHEGMRRVGSPCNYYNTPEAAFEEIVSQITDEIAVSTRKIKELTEYKQQCAACLDQVSLADCLQVVPAKASRGR